MWCMLQACTAGADEEALLQIKLEYTSGPEMPDEGPGEPKLGRHLLLPLRLHLVPSLQVSALPPQVCSFIHSSRHPDIHSLIASFVRSFVRLFIHSFTDSFLHSFTHPFTHSIIPTDTLTASILGVPFITCILLLKGQKFLALCCLCSRCSSNWLVCYCAAAMPHAIVFLLPEWRILFPLHA